MICLEFPPVNSTGNYRSAAFAKNLQKLGVDVTVLTTDVPSGIKTFQKKEDPGLLKGLEELNIIRFPIVNRKPIWETRIGCFLRIWFSGTDDIAKRWFVGKNKNSICKLITEIRPDALYTSLPPFSLSSVAVYLSKKFNLPLVSDMRDAWSLWSSDPYSTRFHYLWVKRLENRLFKQSSSILGVTKELIEDFKHQHPLINATKFTVIFNGLDEFLGTSQDSEPKQDGVFKIGYVGSYYYNPDSEDVQNKKWFLRNGLSKFHYWPRKENWIYRSPYFFLQCLSQVKDKLNIGVEFHHIGRTPSWLPKIIKTMNLENHFVNHGFQDKAEVLKIQSSWNAILATAEKIENRPHFCLPSKSFDSIASGKPIFAFIGEGAQRSFYSNFESVLYFDPDNIELSSSLLREAIQNSIQASGYSDIPSTYKRSYQAVQLNKLLMKVLN